MYIMHNLFGKDQFALVRVRSGKPFSYYAGACWEGNPLFPNQAAWLKYLEKEVTVPSK
jgi:hypothetical protein